MYCDPLGIEMPLSSVVSDTPCLSRVRISPSTNAVGAATLRPTMSNTDASPMNDSIDAAAGRNAPSDTPLPACQSKFCSTIFKVATHWISSSRNILAFIVITPFALWKKVGRRCSRHDAVAQIKR